MTVMPFTFNGLDLTPYAGVYGYVETIRRIAGPNEGGAINGDMIWDTVARKYDVVYPLRPLTMAQIYAIITACNVDEGQARYKTVETNALKTRTMRADISALTLALKSSSKEYFNGLSITFTEK